MVVFNDNDDESDDYLIFKWLAIMVNAHFVVFFFWFKTQKVFVGTSSEEVYLTRSSKYVQTQTSHTASFIIGPNEFAISS